ncbi:MAG TPA: neutral/alkaline non-lysosomal ceramidase N-terminal domain-containing protein [Chitinophagales bacterium]|nr:neutral/alkaline non-lysosomal ceramidase N-terminal domain-containing protein [Chitinophagales bacterium]
MFEAGTAKSDITAYKKGVGMLGYAKWNNRVLERGTGLNARAFVFRNTESGNKFAFVNAEIAFITSSVKRGVVKKLSRHYPSLSYTDENIFLSAQHTHSAPGGYSHYGFYNFSIPGFVPEIYQQIVDGITQAIVAADKALQPVRLFLSKGTFAPDIEVAFNRSLRAYNRNPEAKKYSDKEWHLAIDRDSLVLRVESMDGAPLAMINWFGVHCTSVHNDNHAICFDNKGYAAQLSEEEVRKECGNPRFISAFAQSTAGDVTPNYVYDEKKKWTRGKFEDDFESAKYNGRLQADKALEIFTSARKGEEIRGDIDFGLMYVNFARVTADPEFTNGRLDAHTGPACLGVGFLRGTKEGPGCGPLEEKLATALAGLIKTYEISTSPFLSKQERQRLFDKFKVQGRKKILIETGERKILGSRDVKNLIVPSWADPSIGILKMHHRNGSLDNKPWTPQTLPLHIVTLGNIALAGIPGEITTVAGWRLRDSLYSILKKKGIHHIILTTYSNDYCGYITTYEEYQEQCYEGGHTVFGEWTLAAFQTKFKQLALEMLKHPAGRNIPQDEAPIIFTDDELKKRSYQEALVH